MKPSARRGTQGFVALVLLLVLAACSQTAVPDTTLDPSTWAPGTGSVSGNVVNRKAGTDLEGVRVTLVGTDISTTTDVHGFYRLFNIPAGYADLAFSKDSYALSTVAGLRVGDRAETKYDTIVAEAFDPYLPVVSPTLTVSLENGASAPGGDAGLLTFSVTGTVANPEANRLTLGTVGLGRAKGTSGALGASEPGAVVDMSSGAAEIEVSTAGFDGETSVHITAYDLNSNRTEVVRYVTIDGSATGGALGTLTNLGAFAVTFGDTAQFGDFSASGTFSGAKLAKAARENDVAAIRNIAKTLKPQASLSPQGYLDEGLIWSDVVFSYEGDTLPTAFIIYRHLIGRPTGGLVKLGQVSPAQAELDPEDPENTLYFFRDSTAGLEAGVETRYVVEAVYGDETLTSGDAFVTPLPVLGVEAVSPANDETDVSVEPDYAFAVTNRSSLLYVGVAVLDRVQAEGAIEWAALLADDTGVTEGAIPHNFDGSAVNDTLQPYHGYDWQPIALSSNGTLSEDGSISGENAISVGADFFDLFGLGLVANVQDGPVNTFSTGDGSF